MTTTGAWDTRPGSFTDRDLDEHSPHARNRLENQEGQGVQQDSGLLHQQVRQDLDHCQGGFQAQEQVRIQPGALYQV